MITYYRYQERARQNFKKWIKKPKHKFATILLPTGCGKTVTAVGCLDLFPGKVLWVAHREELIDQAYNTITKILPHKKVSIEMGDRHGDPNSEIIVASVQTLARTRAHLANFEPDLIFIDEYHHYSEKNIQYGGLIQRFPQALVLGATATPWRFSGEELPLGEVLIQMDIGTAVKHGYLVNPTSEALMSNTSLAAVKTQAGDFAIGQLAQAVNVDSRNQLIASKVVDLVQQGRSGLLFGVDVAHAKAMYQLLKDRVRAAELYGDTPKDERNFIIEQMRNQELDVIVNNLILTEGTDFPHISFVCMARPTRSLGLYIQAIGRGLRTSPDKDDCIIVDVCDKIKAKQSQATFADMAAQGDLYGNRKRAQALVKAELDLSESNHLNNFPVFVTQKRQQWTIDEHSFSVESWTLGEYQWLVTWTAAVQVDENITLEPHQIPKVNRLFYLCFPSDEKPGRVLSFIRDRDSLYLKEDKKLNRAKADQYLVRQAKQDKVWNLVKSGAKWKENPASDKQLNLISSLIEQERLDFGLDLATLSKGEASAVVDQAKWQQLVHAKLGASAREKLLGYDILTDDV